VKTERKRVRLAAGVGSLRECGSAAGGKRGKKFLAALIKRNEADSLKGTGIPLKSGGMTRKRIKKKKKKKKKEGGSLG